MIEEDEMEILADGEEESSLTGRVGRGNCQPFDQSTVMQLKIEPLVSRDAGWCRREKER